MKYIQVIGGSGAGKSTFARALADKFDITYIEVDSIFIEENWGMKDTATFRRDIRSAIKNSDDGWVIDSMYASKLGDIIAPTVDAVIFLNIPLRTRFTRVFKRSVRRVTKKELLWGKNTQTVKGAYSFLKFVIKSSKDLPDKVQEYKSKLDLNKQEFIEFKSNKAALGWLAKK